jgi:predicted nucleic-acid-binding protein
MVLASVYDLKPEDQARAIEMLLDHRQLVLHDHESVTAALELFRSRPSLGVSVCLVLELARRARYLPLGTFDRNLTKIEGAQKL